MALQHIEGPLLLHKFHLKGEILCRQRFKKKKKKGVRDKNRINKKDAGSCKMCMSLALTTLNIETDDL